MPPARRSRARACRTAPSPAARVAARRHNTHNACPLIISHGTCGASSTATSANGTIAVADTRAATCAAVRALPTEPAPSHWPTSVAALDEKPLDTTHAKPSRSVHFFRRVALSGRLRGDLSLLACGVCAKLHEKCPSSRRSYYLPRHNLREASATTQAFAHDDNPDLTPRAAGRARARRDVRRPTPSVRERSQSLRLGGCASPCRDARTCGCFRLRVRERCAVEGRGGLVGDCAFCMRFEGRRHRATPPLPTRVRLVCGLYTRGAMTHPRRRRQRRIRARRSSRCAREHALRGVRRAAWRRRVRAA